MNGYTMLRYHTAHGDERSARNRYEEALALYEQLHEQAGIEQVPELLKALEG